MLTPSREDLEYMCTRLVGVAEGITRNLDKYKFFDNVLRQDSKFLLVD